MLSLVIPVRDWPADRIEACVKSFLRLASSTLSELIVIDFGSTTPISLSRATKRSVKLVRLESPIWSLAEAINAGVLAAGNDLIAKTDADILISPDSRAEFDDTVAGIAGGAFAMAVTQAIDLHQSLSPPEAFRLISGRQMPSGVLRPKWGQGGLVFFSRQAWDKIGGFDSRFVGWGNEDNDFAERMQRAGFRLKWTDREKLRIFHVWHPSTSDAPGVLSLRARNHRIANEDRSVFRGVTFRHSNFAEVVAPQVMKRYSPLVTLAVATTARPHRERMLQEAINSFRGQIDNDFEVIVADNGSDGRQFGTLKRALARMEWLDDLRLERLEHRSIPAARNLISNLARGRYICVVDDDDLALPNRLADHLRVFERDGLLHGSHGGWIDFDESTGVIERNTGKERTIATLLRGTGKITAHPASFYRADVLRAVSYDESFALGSDFDLALRLANLGLEIPHTHSYVTLRRFHSDNVTITGLSNQVSNGLAARARALESFPWRAAAELDRQAKQKDAPVYCRNQMSIDSIAELIPGYSGTWRLLVPLAALSRWKRQPALRLPSVGGSQRHEAAPMALEIEQGSRPASLDVDPGLLESLLSIAGGDIATQRSRVNRPVFFRSEPMQGLQRARRVKQRLEQLLEVPAQITSDRQSRLDREVPFDWKSLPIKSGERALLSPRFDSLEDALLCLSGVGKHSLMGSVTAVLADYDDTGECYHLLTPPVRGYDQVRTLKFDLERRSGVCFAQIASNGIASELTPNSRSH